MPLPEKPPYYMPREAISGAIKEWQQNGESGNPINWGNEAEMKAEALKIAKEADVIVRCYGAKVPR